MSTLKNLKARLKDMPNQSTRFEFYTVRFYENGELVNLQNLHQSQLAEFAKTVAEYSADNRSISIESSKFDHFEMTYPNALKMLRKFILENNFPSKIKVDVRLRSALCWSDEIIVQMFKVEIEYCNIQRIEKMLVVA